MKYLSFMPDMAIAWARGDKRETRRVITRLNRVGTITEFGPSDTRGYDWCCRDKRSLWSEFTTTERLTELCPLGKPGDVVGLLTTWATDKEYDHLRPLDLPNGVHIWSYFDLPVEDKPAEFGKLRPGRFLPNGYRHVMPRARLVDIGVERVQDITEAGARLEGITETPREPGFASWSSPGMREYYATPRRAFKVLWDSINAKREYGWDVNPLVWVYRLEPVS